MSRYRVPGHAFTIREIVMDPGKRKETAENELTRLFCDILLSHQITLDQWELMTDRYWRRRYPNDPIRAAQEKTNASRALTSNNLTWMRFDEFIQCLGAENYEYSVTLHFKDKPPSTHTLKIRNRHKDTPIAPVDDDEDDLLPVGSEVKQEMSAADQLEYEIKMRFASFDEPESHTTVVTKNKESSDE